MSIAQDRRAKSTGRVSLSTLVEICGNEPGIPAFEAQTVDVSARGMHLRTAYLPDDGAPLVCRFEDQGKEIVVEGVVAWRKESARGGEFGVRFTALDARSVDALRGLVTENVQRGGREEGAEPGARVRLHIEGLGSPMKARVRDGGSRKVQVGSNLEFLKVGRKLEIEDLEAGARRTASIDGVDVVIDPATQVPQLVVALRYEGQEDDTPEPSTTHLSASPEAAPPRFRIQPERVTTAPSADKARRAPASADDASDLEAEAGESAAAADAEGEDDEVSDEALRGKLGALAGSAGKLAGSAGSALQRASVSTLRGVGKLFSGASGRIAELRAKNTATAKRTTAAPPGGPVSIVGKKVRQQQSSKPEVSAGALATIKQLPAKKKLAIGAGSAVVLVSVLAIALKPSATEPPGASASESGPIVVQSPAASIAGPSGPGATAASPSSSGGVVANVPLFGPTPLATTEPAPLGPGGDTEGVEALELAEAQSGAEARPAVEDEEFTEEVRERKAAKAGAPSKKASAAPLEPKPEPASKRPEDVAPWGRGRMKLPTIHRLRLDGPGSEIRGVAEPTGFTVLVPGRKAMEKAGGIARRDGRIARIRATNTPGGAQIRLEFKDGVPGYRVRLRRDYVELLISAPAK